MPNRPSHPCKRHAWILVSDGSGCPECARHPLPVTERKPDLRVSASQRGYGAEHRRKRDALLARHPYCADPFGRHARAGKRMKATIRDHVIPLNLGGTDDASNEQALCWKCHNLKIYRDGSR